MYSYKLNQVRLTDSVFSQRQNLVRKYILEFDIDRLMHTFRINAGIKSDAEPLGGWEAPGCGLRGHFTGHFLAACAKLAYGLNDDACRVKAENIIDIMAECAKPNGYLSAFDESTLDTLEQNETYGVWAPYYTLHKIINGLVCCAEYIKSEKALILAENAALYIYNRFSRLPYWKIDNMLRCAKTNPANEFGGIGDTLYSLYELDNNPKILELAKIFDRDYFIGNLSRGNDILEDLHANTHLPLVSAALHRYEITGEPEYRAAGMNFYEFIKPRTFANGNNSSRATHYRKNEVSEISEHWGGAHLTSDDLTGGESESCCAHNTENILNRLLKLDGIDTYGKLEYLNSMECIKYNAVVNCASGITGLSQYHQPMGANKVKKFSSLYNDFWCCTASGVEAMSELQRDIWFYSGDTVIVNMFVSSVLSLDDNIKITMTTDFPAANTVTLQINSGSCASNEIKLKIAFKENSVSNMKINGNRYAPIRSGGMSLICGDFKNGDIISLEATADIKIVPLDINDSDGLYCFMYGNILLACTDGNADGVTYLQKAADGKFYGDNCSFMPLYLVETQPYTVYINSKASGDAKDGSSAYLK